MEQILETLFSAPAGAPRTANVETLILVFGLTACRVFPLVMLAPWFAVRGAQPLLRTSVGLALTMAVVWVAAPVLPSDRQPVVLLTWVARELSLGTMFAVSVCLPFLAVGDAGRLTDVLRGANNSDVLAGASGERQSPLGAFALLIAASIFIALGGPLQVMRVLAESLHTVPLGEPAPWIGRQSLDHMLRLVETALSLSVTFAIPAILALLATEVAVGLIARSAREIPIFFVAMPLRAAVGVGALLISLAYWIPEVRAVSAAAIDAGKHIAGLPL